MFLFPELRYVDTDSKTLKVVNMDDLRIEWLCNRVYDSLDVPHSDAFEELLNRDNGKAELMILSYLDETTEDTKRPLIFYKLVLEQDEQVEVECGTLTFF